VNLKQRAISLNYYIYLYSLSFYGRADSKPTTLTIKMCYAATAIPIFATISSGAVGRSINL